MFPQMTVRLKFEKETKNTFKFSTLDRNQPFREIYIQKGTIQMPSSGIIEVTVAEVP